MQSLASGKLTEDTKSRLIGPIEQKHIFVQWSGLDEINILEAQ